MPQLCHAVEMQRAAYTAMKKDCHLDLWVDCELELRLRRLAEADDRPLSSYMRFALERHADHCEHPEAINPVANRRASLSALPDLEVEFWRNKYLRAIGK